MNFREVISTIGCALFVTLLFCVRYGYMAGDYRYVLMFLLFGVPISLTVTLFFLLPSVAILKRLKIKNVIVFITLPAIIVFTLTLTPILLNSISTQTIEGKLVIENGKIVWRNFGWLLLYNAEPALWAAFAGLLLRQLLVGAWVSKGVD